MEQTLVALIIIVVFALCAIALVKWMGWTIPPVLVQIGGYIIIGILLVLLVRFLWPMLTGGSLHLGMAAPLLGLPLLGLG